MPSSKLPVAWDTIFGPLDDTSRQVHGMVKGLFSRLDPKTPDPPRGHRRGLDGRVGMTRGGSGNGSAAIGGVWHAGHECVRAHRGVWRALQNPLQKPEAPLVSIE